MRVFLKDALELGVDLWVIGAALVNELTDRLFMIMDLPIENSTREIEPS